MAQPDLTPLERDMTTAQLMERYKMAFRQSWLNLRSEYWGGEVARLRVILWRRGVSEGTIALLNREAYRETQTPEG